MIDFETRGRVALITINRPEARNAVNGEVAAGLEAAVDRLEDDSELWAGVIGARGLVFSAGADLKEIAAGRADGLATERGGFAGITRLPRSKPLIAAVDAPALAGGCEIVLSCDLVVASTAASFGIPEVKRALVAGAGGLFRLPRVLPPNVAMQLALTGDPIGAERAFALGMVNKLCPPGDAVGAALRLAEQICANAPLAVQTSRNLVLRGTRVDDDEAWEMTDAAIVDVMRGEDFAEGPRAFIEKRAPVWTGR
ncbi:MAG: enoyl-CoA hydratase [Solirubrobacteraceae bacterium]|jgi:enoyl-CoA hydratase|nr:enoyl-CoA hydratase [Solirubrobacteraceae bacterium]